MKVFGALVLLGLAGCSSSHVYGGPVDKTPYPLLPGSTADPTRQPVGRPTTGANPAASRLACRGASYPKGWIAVAYSSGMAECAGTDEKYSTALLQRYDVLAKETELLVCSDQRVPGNWVKTRMDPDAQPGDRCPSSEQTGPAEDRVMLIRKVR